MHKIKETEKPVCSFCAKEVQKVFKGNGAGTICIQCMRNASKLMQTATLKDRTKVNARINTD